MIESDSWTGKIALLISVQTKEGWLVGLDLGSRELCEGWGNCLKYLKWGWKRNKDFRKGGKLSQGVGALKRGRAGTPLRNMISCCKTPRVSTIPFTEKNKSPGINFYLVTWKGNNLMAHLKANYIWVISQCW